jgi:hypothetical protein
LAASVRISWLTDVCVWGLTASARASALAASVRASWASDAVSGAGPVGSVGCAVAAGAVMAAAASETIIRRDRVFPFGMSPSLEDRFPGKREQRGP